MKQDYMSFWRKKGFKEYYSPWVPVSEKNLPLIKKGNLSIDVLGTEIPYLVGRELEILLDGTVIEKQDRHQNGETSPETFVLTWVDARNKNERNKFLAGNPFAGIYFEYSQVMKSLLQKAFQAKIPLVKDVQFPLFHGTDSFYAQTFLRNGIDISLAWARKIAYTGCAFCLTDKAYLDLGSFTGADVKFIANPATEPPQWINLNERFMSETISPLDKFLIGSLNAFFPRDEHSNLSGLYLWSTVCSELIASSIKIGPSVFVFDDFQNYKAVEIIKK